jgi:hypothetical protein
MNAFCCDFHVSVSLMISWRTHEKGWIGVQRKAEQYWFDYQAIRKYSRQTRCVCFYFAFLLIFYFVLCKILFTLFMFSAYFLFSLLF